MAAVSCYAVSRWSAANFSFPSASLPLRAKSMSCLTVKPQNSASPMLLRSSIISPYLSPSSFAGVSLGLDLKSSGGTGNPTRKRGGGLVVRAAKYVLCQTKRNRSRKSLARTHGFRIRMSTTKGRQVLKRRREKGRWILCTKSNPRSGKSV